MSDIEQFFDAFLGPGFIGAAAAVSVWTGKKVVGPALDEVGMYYAKYTRKRLKNLKRITDKSVALATNTDGTPHIRVVGRVLNDASLYDDDVMQTYAAGLLAGSRNADGSDDRPIYYLSIMDGLTAGQLALFHVLYSGASSLPQPDGRDRTALHAAAWLSEVKDQMRHVSPAGETASDRSRWLTEILAALHFAGLIIDDGTDKQDGDTTLLTFWTTRLGMLLFDWAHGLNDEDLYSFFDRERPKIDLPKVRLKTIRAV